MPINIEKLTYSYHPGRAPDISGLSFDLGAGDYLGIVGLSGSGKTTLALLMAGLLRPDSGRVLINGEDINGRKFKRSGLHRRLSLLMYQPEKQLFESTVEREIAWSLRRRGLSAEDISAAVRDAMESVGLDFEALRGLSPLALPLLQRRLVALAALLVSGPAIIVLDEPLAGLDAADAKRFLDALDGLNKKGIAVVHLTRDSESVVSRANRAAVLSEGRLVAQGSARELFAGYTALSSFGIDVPNVCRAGALLRERGVNMPENVVSYEQFIDRLKIIMWRKEK